jgi:small subunit ribosomal protein S8
MTNYPVGDLLIRIKNAYLAGKQDLAVPYSKMSEAVVKVLKDYSLISGFKVQKEKTKNQKVLVISLSYPRGKPALNEIKIISKPGRRVYASVKKMPFPPAKSGLVLVSTSKGVLTAKEATKSHLGGEVICYIW